MPESFELIFWGILIATLWLRGMRRAAKRQRAASEVGDPSSDQSGPKPTSDQLGVRHQTKRRGRATPPMRGSVVPRSVPLAERGHGLRDRWTKMARQIERQMQEAAGEGRPGSLVAHVDDDDVDETVLTSGRRVSREGVQSVLSTPERSPSSRSNKKGAFGSLDRYPQLQRAVIFSEILGTPLGLKDDELDLQFDRRG